MSEKKCSVCQQIKHLTDFCVDETRLLGRYPQCKKCVKERGKKNKIVKSEYDKVYRRINAEQIRIKAREKKKRRWVTDIDYRIKENLRTRIRNAIYAGSKSKQTMQLIGCSVEEFKTHIEKGFCSSMNWSNYGVWHIDHIRPCASFDLSKPEEQASCFHYTNLQPLWAKDNLAKGARL